MDTSSEDKGPSETKASATHNAENASLVLETGNLVTPRKHTAEVAPDLCTPQTFKSPLNFSTVTVEQLGITPESFVKNSSGKSSSYLKKSRRRSAVGTRGSPETNHLIRFMAQQRALKSAEKSPLARGSPFQGSPGLYRNVNSLRERISAFQSAFHSIEENEKMAPCLETTEAEEGSETMGLARKESQGGCWQPGFPGELSSKRRKMCSRSSAEDGPGCTEGAGLGPQAPSAGVDRDCAAGATAAPPEESREHGLSQSGCTAEESVPCLVLTEASSASSFGPEQMYLDVFSLSHSNAHLEGLEVADGVQSTGSSSAVPLDPLRTGVSSGTVPEDWSPATSVCRREVPPTETFVLRSVLKKPCMMLSPESLQEYHSNLCDDAVHPSLASNLSNCCREQKAEDQENCQVPTFLNTKRRKKVTFGEELSPEVFDESLPANTPLRKGGTPACHKDLSRLSPQLLEQSPVPERLPQPDFDDKGENLENIEPLQISFAVLSPNKSLISETFSGTDTFSSSNNHKKIPSYKAGSLTQTSNRRNDIPTRLNHQWYLNDCLIGRLVPLVAQMEQLASSTEENVCNLYNADAQPYKEKKINRRRSQETKCTKRAVPKKKQVFKSGRKKKRKGKKSVEKSLYGEREIASKKPLLSPIPELPEVPEATCAGAGIRRLHPDDFSSTSQLGKVGLFTTLTNRQNLWLRDPYLRLQPDLDGVDTSERCHSEVACSSPPSAASDEDPDTNTGTEDGADTPRAESKQEYESELGSEMETESSRACCAPVTEEHHMLASPGPDLSPPCREGAVAAQSVKKLCQIFQTDADIKLEEQDDVLVATEGKLQCNSTSGLRKESSCLEDDLTGKRREPESRSVDVESQPAESGSAVGCRERKHRRHSLCHLDDHSVRSQQNGAHSPSCAVGSSAEVSLENPELCRDLCDTIEQAFQRTSSETKVRRSTRLRRESEGQGLVWLSLPFPSTSQRAKRRTICTLDSREFESLCPRKETVCSRQNPDVLASISGEQSSEGLAAASLVSSRLPGKRRRSFCASALPSAGSTTQPAPAGRGCLKEKGESLQGSHPDEN